MFEFVEIYCRSKFQANTVVNSSSTSKFKSNNYLFPQLQEGNKFMIWQLVKKKKKKLNRTLTTVLPPSPQKKKTNNNIPSSIGLGIHKSVQPYSTYLHLSAYFCSYL